MKDQDSSSALTATLERRFCNLWQSCVMSGKKARPDLAWLDLYNHYRERQRHYHTIDHIGFCLGKLDRVKDDLDDAKAVEMAIWFHDAIYNPYAHDNEQRSREYFEELCSDCLEADFVRLVGILIMTTEHQHSAEDIDQKYICDIDLASFAKPWDRFLMDCEDLRCEQSNTPDAVFYHSKLKFLSSLLDRNRIFLTEPFYQSCEIRARDNIRRFVDIIQAGHFQS